MTGAATITPGWRLTVPMNTFETKVFRPAATLLIISRLAIVGIGSAAPSGRLVLRICRPDGSDRTALERRVDEIDEMADVLVLPSATPLIHRVAEGHARVGIGESE